MSTCIGLESKLVQVDVMVGSQDRILPDRLPTCTRIPVGADVSALGAHHYIIVLFGTWAEFILPLLIVLGLFTRLASLGFLGFILVMSFVDIRYHGVDASTVGALFDPIPSSLIVDQRLLWIFLLLVLIVKGEGRISLDALLGRMKRGG